MAVKIDTTLILLGLTTLWVVFQYPVGYILLTAAVAVAAFMATSDMKAPLGVVIFMIILRVFGEILKPSARAKDYEGFQAKDPITIHQRIAEKKQEPKKVDTITGVLESPNILGNLHISELRAGEEGFANSTQPAANMMNSPPIPTPAESSFPQPVNSDAAVKMNPALITGEDPAAMETAMTSKGSNLYAPVAAETGGVNASGPAEYQ